MTRVLAARTASGDIDREAVAEAGALLRAGRLVAFPTETVYGLGANALDAEAVERIFVAKGRPKFNPLIVHVSDRAQAKELTASWPELAERLANAFWPGPLTLVLPRAPQVPSVVTGGLPSVALRAPAHPVARALLQAAGVPIAAPSANRYGAVSPTRAEHVVSSLGGRIDAVLDGGACDVGIESTVLDLTSERPRLLRPGGITLEQIEAVIGPTAHEHVVQEEGARVSPGLTARHYAPDAETFLAPAEEIHPLLASLPPTARVGAIVRTLSSPDDERVVAWERLGDDAPAFARELYAALHRLEVVGVTHVLMEAPPSSPEWAAVADRLSRAAG